MGRFLKVPRFSQVSHVFPCFPRFYHLFLCFTMISPQVHVGPSRRTFQEIEDFSSVRIFSSSSKNAVLGSVFGFSLFVRWFWVEIQ